MTEKTYTITITEKELNVIKNDTDSSLWSFPKGLTFNILFLLNNKNSLNALYSPSPAFI